jgi:hypothetical protein
MFFDVMKKQWLLFLALFLVFSNGYALEDTPFFSDVSEENPHREAIEFFHSEEIFRGNKDGFFLPEAKLSRAEFAAIISRTIIGEPDANRFRDCFPDVQNEWFARYVCSLRSLEIMKGFSAGEMQGQFGPHEQISVGEVLVTLSRLSGWGLVEGESWYGPAMYHAAQKNILTNKTFDEKIHRDLMAESLFRTLAMQQESLSLEDEYTDEIGDDFIALRKSVEEPIPLAQYFPGAQTSPQEESPLKDASITITSVSETSKIADGLSTIFIQFQIADAEGTLIPDRDISALLVRPSATLALEEDKDATSFPVHELSDGQYQAEVRTTVAGDHTLLLLDEQSRTSVSESLSFLPGEPAELVLLKESGPGGLQPLHEKHYFFSVIDEYGNEVEAQLRAETEWGKIDINEKEAVFTADAYGLANIVFTATAGEKNFSYADSFDVLPVGIDYNVAYPVSDETFAVPIHLFAPSNANTLYFSFDFEFSEDFIFDEITLYEDVFQGEIVVTPKKKIGVSGELIVETESLFEGAIGQIVFHKMPLGIHEITGGVVVNAESTEEIERLLRGENGALNANENGIYTPDSRPLATITGKSKKTICIETYIAPNAQVSQQQALSDIQQAEDIFYKNAQDCDCPHYLQIDHRYYQFSSVEWQKIFGQGEGDNPAEVHPEGVGSFLEGNTETITPLRACTKVFYVQHNDTHAGESVRPRSFYDGNSPKHLVGPYIILDNRRDTDGRTLAHELAHHLSGNRIADPDQSRGLREGATQIGNLMNYDQMSEDGTIRAKKTGDNLTKDQCDLISWDHDRFSVYPVR